MKPRIIFFGSSKYSVIVEKSLQEHFSLSLVVTLPDRVIGRKQILTPSPVKIIAEKHQVPVITTETLTSEIIEQIHSYKPDFGVVADYRIILPKQLLTIPKYAFLNVHHSLLPKYRGPSPAPSAILSNEKTTGVSIIMMNEQVDTGDILSQKEYNLLPDDTTDSLLTTLNTFGAEILLPIIKNFSYYHTNRIKQKESAATLTTFMDKSNGYIPMNNPPSAIEIDRMIRAYYPWPGVWTTITVHNEEKILKLLPGNFVQLEGKNKTPLKDFFNGYPNLKNAIEPFFRKK